MYEKTNLKYLCSDQVRHKPGCTITKESERREILYFSRKRIVLSVLLSKHFVGFLMLWLIYLLLTICNIQSLVVSNLYNYGCLNTTQIYHDFDLIIMSLIHVYTSIIYGPQREKMYLRTIFLVLEKQCYFECIIFLQFVSLYLTRLFKLFCEL